MVRSHQRPIVSGVEEMVGAEGVIEKDTDTCWLRYRGELWQVSSPDKWQDGDHVRIMSVVDHVCEVEKKE